MRLDLAAAMRLLRILLSLIHKGALEITKRMKLRQLHPLRIYSPFQTRSTTTVLFL